MQIRAASVIDNQCPERGTLPEAQADCTNTRTPGATGRGK